MSGPGPQIYFRTLIDSPIMRVGDFLYSATRAFRLGLQEDGNLVLYALDDFDAAVAQYASNRLIMEEVLQIAGYSRPIWATGTNGSNARSWRFQVDGNLVVYRGDNADGQPVWASNSVTQGETQIVCQDDGNLVIYVAYEKGPGRWWSSNTYAGGR
jgi:hypothetical protein